jgi:hypothetical protein
VGEERAVARWECEPQPTEGRGTVGISARPSGPLRGTTGLLTPLRQIGSRDPGGGTVVGIMPPGGAEQEMPGGVGSAPRGWGKHLAQLSCPMPCRSWQQSAHRGPSPVTARHVYSRPCTPLNVAIWFSQGRAAFRGLPMQLSILASLCCLRRVCPRPCTPQGKWAERLTTRFTGEWCHRPVILVCAEPASIPAVSC